MPTNPEQLSRQLQPTDSAGNPTQLITLYELDLTPKGGTVLYFHDGINVGDSAFKDGVSNGTITFTSATAVFVAGDVGKPITGPNIVMGTTIAARNSATSINLSQAASGSGSGLTFTIVGRNTGNQIVFKLNTYNPFPIRAESFEWTTKGTLPRPKLTVSNIGNVTSALCLQYGDLVGCLVTVRRTFYCYTDNGSEPDVTKEFVPQIFVIDQKVSETNANVSFELATPMDAEGTLLPRRQILATACPFTYRGVECGYVGNPNRDRLGQPFGILSTGGTISDFFFNNSNQHIVLTKTGAFLAADATNHVRLFNPFGAAVKFQPGTYVATFVNANQVRFWPPALVTGTADFVLNRLVDRGLYSTGTTYALRDFAYVMVGGIRVYYVSQQAGNLNHPVTDEAWWMIDVCGKKFGDCEDHFLSGQPLPYGGWPGANKLH